MAIYCIGKQTPDLERGNNNKEQERNNMRSGIYPITALFFCQICIGRRTRKEEDKQNNRIKEDLSFRPSFRLASFFIQDGRA